MTGRFSIPLLGMTVLVVYPSLWLTEMSSAERVAILSCPKREL
jgi:hypothetical protein